MNLECVQPTEEALAKIRTTLFPIVYIDKHQILRELDAALWAILNGEVSKEDLGEEFVSELIDKLNLVMELLKEAGKGPY